MLRRQFLGWQLAALLSVCAVASAQEPARKPGANENAALLYWQAFGQLSELRQEERFVAEGLEDFPGTKSTPAERQRVFQKSADAAKTIYRAARMPRCDWDQDPSQGTAPVLPRTQMCRSLARFLLFRANHQFEQGQPRAALDDILAGFTLARHTAADNSMFGLLVGSGIEGTPVYASLEHLQQMEPATLDALQAGLDRLPPRPTWKAVLAQDKRRLDEWLIPQFAATSDPEAWKATLRRMYPDNLPKGDTKAVDKAVGKASPNVPKVKPAAPKVQQEVSAWPGWPRGSALIERFGTREALVRHLQEGHKLLDELAQFPFPPPGKPSPELRAKIDEMEKRSPFFYEYCSMHPACYHQYLLAAVRLQMLRAAIAIQRHGPEAIKDYPDPSGDGPFEYRKRTEGFELVAKLNFVWRPMTIKVGPLAKGETRIGEGAPSPSSPQP
jgi:hypothetical protein